MYSMQSAGQSTAFAAFGIKAKNDIAAININRAMIRIGDLLLSSNPKISRRLESGTAGRFAAASQLATSLKAR